MLKCIQLTKMDVVSMFISLSQRVPIMFKVPTVTLDVPYHQILPGQFIMIRKMTNQPTVQILIFYQCDPFVIPKMKIIMDF